MKRKVLIVSYSLDVGGVERALLGFLSCFDYTRADVVLKLGRKKGNLLNTVPKEVEVMEIKSIKQNWDILTKPLLPQIKRLLCHWNTLNKGLNLVRDYVFYKIQGHYHRLFKDVLSSDEDTTCYDLAISYAGPSSLLDYYVAKKITAKHKVAWIHFDVEKFNLNIKSQMLSYRCFDKIFVVSKDGKEKFDSKFPASAYKSEVFHNIINPTEIKRLASDADTTILKDNGKINIVTVGRLSKEKGQDLIIKAVYNLVKSGYNVFITLVGGGNFYSDLKHLAENLGIPEHISFTGECSNPYPYMAGCDIYVQPSLHEGFCITLAEAKIFGMPIIATNFTGAREQLEVYHNSRICSHTPEDLSKAIASVIDTGLYKSKHPSKEIMKSEFIKIEEFLK